MHTSHLLNQGLKDKRLSLSAIGVLFYMTSRQKKHEFTLDELESKAPDNRNAVVSFLKELENCGYLTKKQHDMDAAKTQWVLNETQ